MRLMPKAKSSFRSKHLSICGGTFCVCLIIAYEVITFFFERDYYKDEVPIGQHNDEFPQIVAKLTNNFTQVKEYYVPNAPRVICWIATFHKNHCKAEAVYKTWGKRCNKTVIFSANENEHIPCPESYPYSFGHGRYCCNDKFEGLRQCSAVIESSAPFYCKHYIECPSAKHNCTDHEVSTSNIIEFAYLPVKSEYKLLWHTTKLAFIYIWSKYQGQFDFIFKADDDSFLFTANLYSYLKSFDPNEKLYLGHQLLKKRYNVAWMSGGAGYILSRESVKHLVGFITSESSEFPRYMRAEDQGIALCMKHIEARFVNVIDKRNRSFLTPISIVRYIYGAKNARYIPKWFRDVEYISNGYGYQCCNPALMSLHYVDPEDMMYLDTQVTNNLPANGLN